MDGITALKRLTAQNQKLARAIIDGDVLAQQIRDAAQRYGACPNKANENTLVALMQRWEGAKCHVE